MSTDIGKARLPVVLDGGGLQSAAGKLLGDLVPEFERYGKIIGASLGVAAVGATVVALAKIGEDLVNAQETIRKATGETGKALENSFRDAEKVATTIPVSFNDAAEAISIAKQRLDLTGPSAVRLAEQMSALARVTGTDVAQNMDQAAVVAERWKIQVDRLPHSMDELFRVSQLTGTSVQDLEQNMISGGQVLQQYGFSFGESAALVGEFEQHGINVTRVLSGLRTGLAKLAKMGVDDPRTFLLDLIKKMQDAKSATAATGEATAIFGARTGAELANAARTGGLAIDGLAKQVEHSGDTIQNAEKDTRNLGAQWELLKNRLEVAVAPAAIATFEGLGSAVEFVASQVGVMGQGLSGTRGKIAGVAAAAAGGALALQGIAGSVRAVGAAFSALGGEGIVGLLAANPWIALGAAIGGGAAALLLFRDRANAVGAAMKNATSEAHNLQGAMDALQGAKLSHEQAGLDIQTSRAQFTQDLAAQHQAFLKYGKDSTQYQAALDATKQALINWQQAQLQWKTSAQDAATAQGKINSTYQRGAKNITDLASAAKAAAAAQKAHAEAFGETFTKQQQAADTLKIYSKNLTGLISQEELRAQTERKMTGTVSVSTQAVLAQALAAQEYTDKWHHAPTTHELNVYYKQNLQRLIHEAEQLTAKVKAIPAYRKVDIELFEHLTLPHGKVWPKQWGPTPGFPFPGAKGGVFTRPTNLIAGEDPRTTPEILTPAALMREIVHEESGGGGGDVFVTVKMGEQTLDHHIEEVQVRREKKTARRIQVGSVWAPA